MVHLESPTFMAILADETTQHRQTTGETYESDYYTPSQITLNSFTVTKYNCNYDPDTETTGLRNRFRTAMKRAVNRFGSVEEVPSFLYKVEINLGFWSPSPKRQVGFFETLKNGFYQGQVSLHESETEQDVTLTLPDKSRKHYSLIVH